MINQLLQRPFHFSVKSLIWTGNIIFYESHIYLTGSNAYKQNEGVTDGMNWKSISISKTMLQEIWSNEKE